MCRLLKTQFYKSLFVYLALSLVLFSNLNLAKSEDTTKSEAVVAHVTPTLKMVLTTTEGLTSIEQKAEAIKELIRLAPINHTIILVFKPNGVSASKYKKLSDLIQPTIKQAKLEKNIKVRAQFVNETIANEAFLVASEITGQDIESAILSLEEEGLISVDQPPDNFVRKLDRSKSIGHNIMGAFGDTGRALVDAARKTSVFGITVATVATALGASTLGPSWVYVSDGELSKSAIASFALSTLLLYSIPRNEALTRSFYETGYEFVRSLFWQSGRYINKLIKPKDTDPYYLSEPSPTGFEVFKVSAAAMLFSFPLQAAFYSLQDGSIIWNQNTVDVMIRNSVLLGLASAPWSFLTEKLKSETSLSKNAITILRSIHLGSLGYLATGIIPYSFEGHFYEKLSFEEALLIGSAAVGYAGVLADKPLIRLMNKWDRNKWFRFANKNIQALTDMPDKLFRSLFIRASRRRGLLNAFVSLDKVEDEIFEEQNLKPVNQFNQCYVFLNSK